MKPLSNLSAARAAPRRIPRTATSSGSASSPSCSSSLPSSSSPLHSSTRSRSDSASSSSSAGSSRSLYTASNSSTSSIPLSFFDSPAPPTPSRPARLPVKESSNQSGSNNGTQAQHPSFQLALSGTTLHPNDAQNPNTLLRDHSLSLFGYRISADATSSDNSATTTIPFYSYTPPHIPSTSPGESSHLGLRLDVGAYGIPKNGKRVEQYTNVPHTELSVQIGEDAYFLRENALGIADGVGGWAKKDAALLHSRAPTPSAMFARRLMHFCSSELGSSHLPRPPHLQTPPPPPVPMNSTPSPPLLPRFFKPPAFQMHVRPLPPPAVHTFSSGKTFPIAPTPALPEHEEYEYDQDQEGELADALEDLSDGIDVLRILEKAWERTCGAHVVQSRSSPPPPPQPQHQTRTGTKHEAPRTVPLLSGSSTALVAVLGAANANTEESHTASETGKKPELAPELTFHPALHSDAAATPDSVLRIAHIGDSMGMLVRGDAIAWRSEELWYRFNTPHQLSPTSPAPTHPGLARTYTLPVQADDILILASDGLSDNLWDEEVLDVVLRVRGLAGLPATTTSAAKGSEDAEAATPAPTTMDPLGVLRRSTLAGILSEALCSRARRASELGPAPRRNSNAHLVPPVESEVPFARRAREHGKVFKCPGKIDDISVIVAVISPTGI